MMFPAEKLYQNFAAASLNESSMCGPRVPFASSPLGLDSAFCTSCMMTATIAVCRRSVGPCLSDNWVLLMQSKLLGLFEIGAC